MAEQSPTNIPLLQWSALKNVVYPNEQAAGGGVRLTDGIYSQKTQPGSAPGAYFQLSHLRIFGDLDGDDVEDALVILMVDHGGPGTSYYLNAVLNQGGRAFPAASQFLGEQVFIRSMAVEDGEIRLVLDTGEEDYTCCPKDSKQYTYRLEGEQFELLGVVDLPDPQVGGRVDNPPWHIQLEPGMTSTTIEREIGFNQIDHYLVSAAAGQLMTVEIISPHTDVLLSIYGEDGGEVLTSVLAEANTWTGALPVTQDYRISAVAAGAGTAYSLFVDLAASGGGLLEAPEEAGSDDTPSEDDQKVVYLTFDDGPTAKWTPQILEVLARYGARATFFVLGEQAKQYPELIEQELAAGHTLGNHSFYHLSMDGVTRQGFLREVESTAEILGDAGAQCMRPPYGAVDAYTRLYAVEIGYKVVLWDIDTQDWRRPGVTAIMTNVLNEIQPGDVVLFHDGGGDRSQTVRALALILKALTEQGYVFESICQ
jgi:peptidoglycan/xylan/chitin deacetylase (PgdA/CDA1 family)